MTGLIGWWLDWLIDWWLDWLIDIFICLNIYVSSFFYHSYLTRLQNDSCPTFVEGTWYASVTWPTATVLDWIASDLISDMLKEIQLKNVIIIIIIIYFLDMHFFHAQLRLDVFPDIRLLHISLNTTHSESKPSSSISSFTHSLQVILPLSAHLTPATTTFLQANIFQDYIQKVHCFNIPMGRMIHNYPRVTNQDELGGCH